ncbi:jg21852 [Pararge aegeria aegeria]|uniref:Jg21852 protein n=1 Tax=Pararge aegeria aegeria TaxID=348720 RepID=A0A8S4QZH2_9NEOP|nr:jg21852 [Pararge aegeria aegeria]
MSRRRVPIVSPGQKDVTVMQVLVPLLYCTDFGTRSISGQPPSPPRSTDPASGAAAARVPAMRRSATRWYRLARAPAGAAAATGTWRRPPSPPPRRRTDTARGDASAL